MCSDTKGDKRARISGLIQPPLMPIAPASSCFTAASIYNEFHQVMALRPRPSAPSWSSIPRSYPLVRRPRLPKKTRRASWWRDSPMLSWAPDHPAVLLDMDDLEQVEGLEDPPVVGEGVPHAGEAAAGHHHTDQVVGADLAGGQRPGHPHHVVPVLHDGRRRHPPQAQGVEVAPPVGGPGVPGEL